jgi:hypothetical protein
MKLTEKQYQEYFGKKEVKQNKYHNTIIEYNNIKFDSIKEKNRYVTLKQLEDLGVIKDLKLQVKFELQPSFKYRDKTIRSINYYADFTYIQDNKLIVEDTKGYCTKEYLLKKKLLLYKYKDIEFKEIN